MTYPDPRLLRRALYSWAFNKNAWSHEPNEDWRKALEWMKRNSVPVGELMDADVLRRGLDALGCKLGGRAASARTARRKRAAFGEVLNRAVERGYFERDPLNGVRWSPPAVNEEVDPAGVPKPGQVARLIAAVASSLAAARTWRRSSAACTTRPCGRPRSSISASNSVICRSRDGGC